MISIHTTQEVCPSIPTNLREQRPSIPTNLREQAAGSSCTQSAAKKLYILQTEKMEKNYDSFWDGSKRKRVVENELKMDFNFRNS